MHEAREGAIRMQSCVGARRVRRYDRSGCVSRRVASQGRCGTAQEHDGAPGTTRATARALTSNRLPGGCQCPRAAPAGLRPETLHQPTQDNSGTPA